MARVAARWRLCYLVVFGSRAKGYAAQHSDYDVAVKAGRRLKPLELGQLYSELEACTGGRLDLLVLDNWDPIAAWEALTGGRLVYYRDRDCLREYYQDKARAIDEVADLEPVIEMFRREMRRALARTCSESGPG